MIKMLRTYHKITLPVISLFEVMQVKSEKSGRFLSHGLGLPAQLLPREPKVTLCGDRVLVENHGGIMSYTRQSIEVRSRNGFVRINGDELQLAAMTLTEIIVRGMVVSVELC